ncbi:MAG TPA: hypothetical protein VGS58_16080 [Candidatus Sulfopaludibacter sp.]|nr:hypothetical protein [Candidatus Sulfopaludibacter sp.]
MVSIQAPGSRAMVSAVARQELLLARPEPGRGRQAQPDEPAPAREQRVS